MSKKATPINPKRAERVKFIRKQEGLTQAEFARLTNQVQQNINRIEKMHQGLTDENAQEIIKAFPNYRIQWLLGYDDYMTTTDELRSLIHNKVDLAEAINEVIRLVADDICTRENIKRPTIPFVYDFSILQTQLHDYAELIVSDYLKNRKDSYFWKRMDSKYHLNRGENDETGER